MGDDTIRSEFERLYSLPPDAEWDAEELVYESASCPDEAFIMTRMLDAFRTAMRETGTLRRQVDAEATVADSYRSERDELRQQLADAYASIDSLTHDIREATKHLEDHHCLEEPDGGSLSLPEQVARMRQELDEVRAQLSNAKSDLESEQWRRRKCAEENEDLRAHCERLRESSRTYMDKSNKNPDERIKARRELEDAHNETPARSLSAVRAEAGREGFVEGAKWQLKTGAYPEGRGIAADTYAQRIRRGEV